MSIPPMPYEFSVDDDAVQCAAQSIRSNPDAGMHYHQCTRTGRVRLNGVPLCYQHVGQFVQYGRITVIPESGSDGIREMLHVGRHPEEAAVALRLQKA